MDELLEQELEEQIMKILQIHDDLDYAEVYEVCIDFINDIPEKIKEETKIKRFKRFVNNEFWLDQEQERDFWNKSFDLSSIPKYLFSGKSKEKWPIIQIKDLTKTIWLTHLFDDANLKIYAWEKVWIIWKNGAGKTTFLKLLIWKEEVEEWEIIINSDIKIWYLSQDLFWTDENNTLEQEMLTVFSEITEKINILNELKKSWENYDKIEEISQELRQIDGFRKFDLQWDILKYFWFTAEHLKMPVKKLSWGEQTKVQIAKFLIQQVDVLILDEPTNHLDIEWILFLEEFCNNWQKTILTISHDVAFLNNTVDRIVEISSYRLNLYHCGYSKYLEEKQKRYDIKLKEYKVQQKELEKQNDYITKFRYKASKASWVQSRIKALDKIDVIEPPEDDITICPINVKVDRRLPEIIFKIQELEVGYKNPIIRFPKKLEVRKSDKIWIIWKNWVGKTTLLKTLLQELTPISWTVEMVDNIKVGSYSQVLEDLDKDETIIKELRWISKNEKEVRKILGWLLIKGEKVNQKIGTLSGWERAKVALTKMLLQQPDIIIMDEPTNHLDIYSKEVIKQMLDWFNWPSIIVSHDRDLLKSVSNQIWVIKDNNLKQYLNIDKAFKHLI